MRVVAYLLFTQSAVLIHFSDGGFILILDLLTPYVDVLPVAEHNRIVYLKYCYADTMIR